MGRQICQSEYPKEKTMPLRAKLRRTFARFRSDESGFITMEWVSLGAGVVVIGLGTVYYLFDATDAVGGKIETAMTAVMVTAPTSPPTVDGQ
jgi:hypothetical protein